MTATPFTSGARDKDGHPDIAEISALTEELLPPERFSELRAHLASCGLCASVLTSLEGIRGSLDDLPDAPGMPDDVAARIDSALATEALLSGPADDPSPVSRETGELYGAGAYAHPEPANYRTAAVSRETGNRRPAGRPGGASGPGRHRTARRVRKWRSAVLVGAGAVVALGLGGFLMQSLNDPAPPTAGSAPEKQERTTEGAALEKHVQGLLAEKESGGTSQGAGSSPSGDFQTKESEGSSPLAGGSTSLPSCVREGVDRKDSPLAVDEKAPYKGGTAYLVVLPHKGDPKRVDAYLVDPSCLEHQGSGPGHVIAKHTYARR